MEYHLKKKLENRRRYKNEDYHRKNHNRHSNIDLSTVLVCNFVINNDNVFYLYVKCPEGAGKGWKAAIRTWIDHFKGDREFRKNIYCFLYYHGII